jgi:acetyl esterase/lipase/uncharacterized membrane protein HdeD (DUF308 family)
VPSGHTLWRRVVIAASLLWGAVLLVRPTDVTSTLARLVGVGLVLLGATFLLRSTVLRSTVLRSTVPRSTGSTRPVFDRVDAAVWSSIGLVTIAWPGPTVRGLAIVVGAGLVATGSIELAGVTRGAPSARFVVGVGALSSIGFGVAALAWPTATALLLSVIVGARLIVAGIGLAALPDGSARDGREPDAAPDTRRTGLRAAIGSAGLLVAVVAAGISVTVNRAQPDEPGAFYDAPAELPGAAGSLIRSEVVEPFIDDATTYRVLYVTSDAEGSPTTSSGLVIVPDGIAPPAGRPVVAVPHGTIGIARRCAPSMLGATYAAGIPGLRGFLDAGYVVSATDFAGLGSQATTGYLVGTSEAYSTLDGVRAAIEMPAAEASERFVVFGESQGGHAALFTGQLAARYAPELELVGVAAAAPATDLASLLRENVGTTFGDVLTAFALSSWRDVYGAELDGIVDEQAIPVIDRLAEQCIQDQNQMIALFPEAELLKIRFLDASPWDVEPWSVIIADNTPGAGSIDAPVLIAQGADDPLVVPPVQQAFVDGWCGRGQPIEYRVVEGVGHLDAGRSTASEVAVWAAARFAGEPWTATCGAST